MEIFIRGKAGEGKSAIAQFIADALEARGLAVTRAQGDVRTPEHLNATLDSLTRVGVHVTIIENVQ